MITEPPLLKVRRDFQRPGEQVLAGFAGVPASYIVDAMGGRGCLDYRIKPVNPASSMMVGVAVTCYAGPGDNLALWGALGLARPGDVLVAATDHFTGTAITGDLLVGIARNRGIAGIVTDGLIRDIVNVLEAGLPVYCAGITANSPARNGPGTVGFPVTVGGLGITSGDIIVGDPDGVVVVPLEEAQSVLARLSDVKASEADLDAKIKDGLTVLPDFVGRLFASDRIQELP